MDNLIENLGGVSVPYSAKVRCCGGMLMTTDEDVALKYNVNAIPRLVFIDKKGDIAFSHEGLMSKERIIEEIEKIE